MRLNIYKNQDMRSEDLLMSFENVKKGDTLEVSGLASNTVYYMNLVDDEDKEIEFEGEDSFSTMYMSDEGEPDYDENGYRIVLEEGGFFLYLGNDKVAEPDGLSYSIGGDIKNASPIDSFPIDISKMAEKEFIVIWQDDTTIAYSEALQESKR